jgi:hypothetical protein
MTAAIQVPIIGMQVDAAGNPLCVVLMRPEQLGFSAVRNPIDGCTACPHPAHTTAPCAVEVGREATNIPGGGEVLKLCACAVLDKTAPRFDLVPLEQPRIVSPHNLPRPALSLVGP